MARITSHQKKALWEFFSKEEWKRGTAFPRQNANKKLDKFLKEVGLADDRDKASRQLHNWKLAKYEHAATTFAFTFQESLEFVQSHMVGINYLEYVKLVVNRMLGNDDVDNTHFNNVRFYVQANQKIGPELLEFILTQQLLLGQLVVLVKFYEQLLAVLLPKRRKEKTAAKLGYKKARETAVQCGGRLSNDFKEALAKVDTTSIMASYSDERKNQEWMKLYLALDQSLEWCWRVENFCKQREPITIPEAPTINESSKSVVSFVGGWIVSCLKTKKGLKRKCMRPTHSFVDTFVRHNSVTETEATADGLPLGYIHRKMKQREKLHYPSLPFYNFLCRVESTYSKNYTLKNLLSHNDGNLLREIAKALLSNESIKRDFLKLFPSTPSPPDPSSQVQKVFEYVLTKYRNMRIKYIGKSHQAMRKRGEDRFEKASLRTRVAVAGRKTEKSSAPVKEHETVSDGAVDSEDDSDAGLEEEVDFDEMAEREVVDALTFEEFAIDSDDEEDEEEGKQEDTEQSRFTKPRLTTEDEVDANDPY